MATVDIAHPEGHSRATWLLSNENASSVISTLATFSLALDNIVNERAADLLAFSPAEYEAARSVRAARSERMRQVGTALYCPPFDSTCTSSTGVGKFLILPSRIWLPRYLLKENTLNEDARRARS
jgi:hypothetical protein